jgi:membrane protease YdiL (CAAX protease family)
VLFSPSEGRLRAGWRLALQAMLQLIFLFAVGVALILATPGVARGLFDIATLGGLAVAELAQAMTVTASVWLARRLLDHRTFTDLGLILNARALVDLAAGTGIALALMAAIFGTELGLGWASVQGFSWTDIGISQALLRSAGFLGVFAAVGWSEELMSRGYHLQTIASGLSLPWGVLLSSAAFGFLHLGNPNATWISAAGIFLAGLFLAYAYVRTRQLWLSIGLHIGWNFFEGVVFGFPVSGQDFFHLSRISVTGPALWTGGAFGPEGGLIVVPAILVGVALMHVYARRRNVVPGRQWGGSPS